MYFRLSGKYDTYGINHQRAVTNGIRDALAKAGRISELRVSSILVCWTEQKLRTHAQKLVNLRPPSSLQQILKLGNTPYFLPRALNS